jgi:hypothetical protein
MRRWWLVVALLLSLGVNLGLVGMIVARRAFSRPAMLDRLERAESPGEALADRLRLVGDERREFLAVQARLAEVLRQERPRLHRLRDELRDELVSGSPDRARLDRLVEEAAAAQSALDRAFVDNALATREILHGEAYDEFLRFLARFAADPRGGPRPELGPRGGPRPSFGPRDGGPGGPRPPLRGERPPPG